MDVRVRLWRKLSAEELILLNCGVGEDSWVPWTARSSNQSILKEISPGCSLEGLMVKLKLQYFGHLVQSWLIGKDSGAGRDWGQEEKGMTEDEMAGWHHRLDGHEFEWTAGVSDGQGGLVCCNSWGGKESDTTEQLNWMTPGTELNDTWYWTSFHIFAIGISSLARCLLRFFVHFQWGCLFSYHWILVLRIFWITVLNHMHLLQICLTSLWLIF